jgi:hypothetical protein
METPTTDTTINASVENLLTSRLERKHISFKALMDIKKLIQQSPSREIVGEGTLTLVNIYAIIEEAEKKLDLPNK